jgi:hypothetical protein
VMFNGSRGRLELEVVESDHVAPDAAGDVKGQPGSELTAASERGRLRLSVHPFWAPPREVPVDGYVREGHGGADARMLADLLLQDPPQDPLGRSATERDGARALLVGLAGNSSLATGRPVRVNDLIEL